MHCGEIDGSPDGFGASRYDVRNIFGFFDPPLVTYKNQLILFLMSAFWGPPSPWSVDVIFGRPLEWKWNAAMAMDSVKCDRPI